MAYILGHNLHVSLSLNIDPPTSRLCQEIKDSKNQVAVQLIVIDVSLIDSCVINLGGLVFILFTLIAIL